MREAVVAQDVATAKERWQRLWRKHVEVGNWLLGTLLGRWRCKTSRGKSTWSSASGCA